VLVNDDALVISGFRDVLAHIDILVLTLRPAETIRHRVNAPPALEIAFEVADSAPQRCGSAFPSCSSLAAETLFDFGFVMNQMYDRTTASDRRLQWCLHHQAA